jgi:NhaP-type Na+/H+ or K+/H+ antiporter
VIGAPLGWLTSALAVHYGAGLGWEASAVFGGIMIVTGPTVIAPLLRQARLKKRPAMLLQWEAIVNDPIGALAAVLAYEMVAVWRETASAGEALAAFAMGTLWAALVGAAAGWGIAQIFRRHWVPEYMKVPVLFSVLLIAFAASDLVTHESGLLAVTIMGIVIANANLPSYEELRRFKEHATVLLVSGVFILLAASLDLSALKAFDARTGLFVLSVVLLARPLTVMVSLLGTGLPVREKLLVAFTGPRGVVLVAVAGLFGERLAGLGVEDGAAVGPLAFALVAATVVLHGFTLVPVARWLGVAGGETPGVLLVGGSRFTLALAEALKKAEVPVLITETNRYHLRAAREAGVPTWYGDILGEASENGVEFMAFGTVIAATDNDAYNTLVATDLAPEFGRENVLQVGRVKEGNARHALPSTLGGRRFGSGANWDELESRMRDGWAIRSTRLSEEFGAQNWRETHPDAVLLARMSAGEIKFMAADAEPKGAPGVRLFALMPPEATVNEAG